MAEDNPSLVQEAYERGLLGPKTRALYEEAQKRGLLGKTSTAQQQDQTIVDLPKAISNIPSSAIKAGQDIYSAVSDPIQTVKNLGALGKGILQHAGIVEGEDAKPAASAVWESLKQRYGSGTALRKTVEDDPVGFLFDLSTVLGTGGGAIRGAASFATKAGMAAEKVGAAGQAISAAGRAVDPISAAVGGAKLGASALTGAIGGLGTMTGGEPLRIGFRAGLAGGAKEQAFTEQLRKTAPMEDAVTEARGAVAALKQERGSAYRTAMEGVKDQNKVLSFNDVDSAIKTSVEKFKDISKSEEASAVQDKISNIVERFKLAGPEYHTAEGLDALKQKIWNDVISKTDPGTVENLAGMRVYDAIKSTIVKQVPEYAPIMKGYEEATKRIKEIEGTLSLGKASRLDTALRKLQSVLRDNVNASYGNRRELAEYLVKNAPTLMEKLAGQSLSAPFARSIGRLGAMLGIEEGLIHGASAAKIAPIAPFLSPRLMGEASLAAGKLARPISQIPAKRAIARGALQGGRTFFLRDAQGNEYQ